MAKAVASLAYVAARQGRYAEADAMFKRELAIREKTFGPDHPTVALALTRYAEVLNDQKRWAEAEPLVDRAIAIRDRCRVAPGVRFESYFIRAKISWNLKEKSDALADLKQAMELAEEQRGQLGGAEHERAESFQKFAGASSRWSPGRPSSEHERGPQRHRAARARSLLDEMNMVGADLLVGRTASEREQLRAREAKLKVRVASLEKQLARPEPRQPGSSMTSPAESPEKPSAGPEPRQPSLPEPPQAERAKLQKELSQARDALYQFYRDERSSNPVYRRLLSVGTGLPRLGQIRRRLTVDHGLLLVYLFGENEGYLLAVGESSERLSTLTVDEAAARNWASRRGRSRPSSCRRSC